MVVTLLQSEEQKPAFCGCGPQRNGSQKVFFGQNVYYFVVLKRCYCTSKRIAKTMYPKKYLTCFICSAAKFKTQNLELRRREY